PGARRVFRAVMAPCVLLGLGMIGLFVHAGGSSDFLAFTLLTLYPLAALLFMWGWRQGPALPSCPPPPRAHVDPRQPLHPPAAEPAAGVAIGSVIALVIAEGWARAFKVALEHRANEEAGRRELEASRNAYRDLAEQANELIFTADLTGRFTYVNAVMARCLGQPESLLVGQPVAGFLSHHP